MILHDYVRVLRRRWWMIVLSAVLGAGVAATFAYTTAPTYGARATVYVATVGNTSPGDLQQGNVFAMQRAPTYAELARTSAVLTRAAAALGDDSDVADLRRSVTTSARTEMALIDIDASGGDPGLVAEQANAVARALTTEASLLDAPGDDSPLQLTVVETAEEPRIATTPRPRNNVLMGTVVGLVLGMGAVVVSHTLDTRIRTAADLPRSTGLATITSIPSSRVRPSRSIPASDVRLEAFRNLRANLLFGTGIRGTIAVAGVTSTSHAHEVACQLATALGEIGSVVVVVDVDFRPVGNGRHSHAPESGSRHGHADTIIRGRLGVADVLNGDSAVDDVLTVGSDKNVYLMAAGTAEPSAAQRVSTPAMRNMLDLLTARFDYVVLACPPLTERSESAVVAALSNSRLVVVEAGATKRSEFLLALELLAGVRATSISVVMDNVRDPDLGAAADGQTFAPAERN